MPTVRPRPSASLRPPRRSAIAVALALTTAGSAAVAPSASATVWRAAADSPENPSIAAGRDIVRAELSFDDVAGTASTTIALGGAPSGDRSVALVLGRKDGTGACGSPALAVVRVTLGTGFAGSWSLTDAGGSEVASGTDVGYQETGTSISMSIASPAIAGGAFDCAQIQTMDALSSGPVLRDAVSVSGLTADPPPAPPAPSTPAAPQPPAPPAPPAPKPPAPKKAPALRVSTAGLPKTVVRNRRYRVTVRVRNVGTAAAKRLKLTVAKTPGVRATPLRATWKRLAAGKSVTRRITVRATSKRTRTVRLRVTGSGKLSATASLRVVPKSKKKPAKKTKRTPTKKTTPPTKGPLVGRYFWGFKSQLDRGWDNYAVLFVDDHWAYVGFPPEGVPSCTAVDTSGRGCQRYTLDAATGALRIGEDDEGTWKDGLTFNGIHMAELGFAPAGARYDVSLLHKDFSGQCGFVTGCTTWTNYFALSADGHFVTSGSSIGSIGGPGGGPSVWSTRFSGDETGSYEILAQGRIRLTYLDGTVEVRTLGLRLDDQGKPAPAEGLLLGGTNYYD